MDALEHRPRPDRVDADPGRERLRQRPRRRPQPRLGDGVGEEVGRELPHPLVDDVDHVARHTLRQIEEQRLGEEHRCLEVDVEVRVPGAGRHRRNRVDEEFRRIVDQADRRAEQLPALRNEPFDVGLRREIPRDRGPGSPRIADLGDQGLRLPRRAAIMHAHLPAIARQIERDRASDTPGAPGDEHSRRKLVWMRHLRKGPADDCTSAR